MKNTLLFAKRNAIETLRDPLLYVFCIGFPAIMLILFQVINANSGGATPVFEIKSLVPGIIVFSFTFVTLTQTLLVSKDKTSAFLIRLYTSPLKTYNFVLGYAIPSIIIGILQQVVCLLFGYITALIVKVEYFSLLSVLALMLANMPILITCVFIGIAIGSLLNDKSAPAIVSILISAAGVLGGAWMPLDTMVGFENFCRFLPFYPSVYIGRIITGATHSFGEIYSFDIVAKLGLIPIAVFLIISVVGAIFAFKIKSKSR
ncbi:MAG: hypothetical protein J6B04_02050 [Clostridia bacterium]|nr:hypothetical protein [Clostridia bacterium]